VRDDLALDFVVGGLGNDLPGDKVTFRFIGTTSNDLLRQRGTNAGQCIELLGARAVDIDEAAFLSRACGCRIPAGWLRWGSLAGSQGDRSQKDK